MSTGTAQPAIGFIGLGGPGSGHADSFTARGLAGASGLPALLRRLNP